jgi:hypothetical protein
MKKIFNQQVEDFIKGFTGKNTYRSFSFDQIDRIFLSINAAPALVRPQGMETRITMEQIVYPSVYNLVIDWPIKRHSLQRVTRFATKCTSYRASTLATIDLKLVPGQPFDIESNIKTLLRIISPKNCSIIRIEDPATPLLKKRELIDHCGNTVEIPSTVWISYPQPQSRISAIVFLRDVGDNYFFLHARMLHTPLERQIVSTLMHNRLYFDAIERIYNKCFADDSLCMLFQDSIQNRCSIYFDVMKIPSGHFISTINDTAVWPQLFLLIAQSMDLELIHVTKPSELEQQTIQEHTMEHIFCIFRIETRNAPHGDLIVVTSHLLGLTENVRQFAAGGRIIWRIKVN